MYREYPARLLAAVIWDGGSGDGPNEGGPHQDGPDGNRPNGGGSPGDGPDGNRPNTDGSGTDGSGTDGSIADGRNAGRPNADGRNADGRNADRRDAADGDRAGLGARRVLPDGCMDIIWSSDGALIVAGPDTAAKLSRWAPGVRHVGLRFDSGTGPARLGVAADELRDQRVPLADVWGSGPARRLAEQLAVAADPRRTLESSVAARPLDPALTDRLVPVIVGHARHQDSVDDVARAVNLSERQLLRRCRPLFGYGPKTLARILRMQAAVRAARAGDPLATTAAEAGYADQAHLAREIRSLTGVPLTRLIGRR